MPTIYEDTNPRELKELVGEVHSGSSVLPEFQRNFVWDPGAIAGLIHSIAQSYPAGSILRIRNTKNLFQWRLFEGVDKPTAAQPVFLVLDGQQRLTSLHSALYGTGSHFFFLDVAARMRGDDLEECIFWEKAGSRKATTLLDPAEQTRSLIFPFSEFLNGDPTAWIDKASETKETENSVPAFKARQKALKAVIDPLKEAIEGYKFPVVTLSDSTEAEAVCTIFETLNRTGVRLSVFELLTARFFPQSINLRELWDTSQTQNPILAEYEVDPYALLQTICALTKSPINIRRSKILNLSATDIETHWANASEAMADGLQLLQQECGVLSAKWLPYAPMLVTLAAVICQRPISRGPSAAEYKRKLCRWFWGATLGQHYETASNTRSERDIPALISWLDGGAAPDTVQASLAREQILITTQRQRALYRAIMCAIVSGRPLDFHTGRTIDRALLLQGGIDDHHIFPLAALGVTDRRNPPVEYDNIVNRTLIDSATNKSINSDAPSIYLTRIAYAQQATTWAQILGSHLINENAATAMTQDEFGQFVDARVKAIEARISEVLANP